MKYDIVRLIFLFSFFKRWNLATSSDAHTHMEIHMYSHICIIILICHFYIFAYFPMHILCVGVVHG